MLGNFKSSIFKASIKKSAVIFISVFLLMNPVGYAFSQIQAAEGDAAGLTVSTAAATDTVISLKWNAVPGASGYNIYRENTKINTAPVTNNSFTVIGLTQNTYYKFFVAAIAGGRETVKSDAYYEYTKCGSVVNNMLVSGNDKKINMPYSDMSLNMEYKGICITDPNYYYWCISPIEDEETGEIHLFTCRWRVPNDYTWDEFKGFGWQQGDMGGWKNICEIAHFKGSTPEGPWTYVDTPVHNGMLPQGQVSPHNVRIKKIDGTYVILFITQEGNKIGDWTSFANIESVTNYNVTLTAGQSKQKECLVYSDSLSGPWTLGGDKGDGVVVSPEPSGAGHWTSGSALGCDNGDIIKIDGKYRIYFKSGPAMNASMKYGYAESDELTKGYVKNNVSSTDNINYIEDATVFEYDFDNSGTSKIYLLTTDNFGDNTNIKEAGILWESQDRGETFKLADAKIGFGLLTDYMAVPPLGNGPGFSHGAYGATPKFERPAVLMQGGKLTYFYAAVPLNLSGYNATQSVVLKINPDLSEERKERVKGIVEFDGNGNTGGSMANADIYFGASFKIPENKFTKTGYLFDGWEASGGASGVYKEGDKVKYIIDDVRLTAIWKAEN